MNLQKSIKVDISSDRLNFNKAQDKKKNVIRGLFGRKQ